MPFSNSCSARRWRPRIPLLACGRICQRWAHPVASVVLAAGKAAGTMSEVAEDHYLGQHRLPLARISELAVTRRGYGRPTRLIRTVEAGHPVPDAAGLAATFETLALADAAGTRRSSSWR